MAMNVGIGFNLQVTAMPGLHSLYDRWYQAMWLFSGAAEDPVNETDGNARCRGTVFRCEEFDPCHLD